MAHDTAFELHRFTAREVSHLSPSSCAVENTLVWCQCAFSISGTLADFLPFQQREKGQSSELELTTLFSTFIIFTDIFYF